jgi:hypothetical protein
MVDIDTVMGVRPSEVVTGNDVSDISTTLHVHEIIQYLARIPTICCNIFAKHDGTIGISVRGGNQWRNLKISRAPVRLPAVTLYISRTNLASGPFLLY